MAKKIRVEEISAFDGQEVIIEGWVYNRTRKGKLVFLLIRDGSGFVQCVAFKPDLEPELFEDILRLSQESAVRITGIVRADKRSPGIPGGYEVGITNLRTETKGVGLIRWAMAHGLPVAANCFNGLAGYIVLR